MVVSRWGPPPEPPVTLSCWVKHMFSVCHDILTSSHVHHLISNIPCGKLTYHTYGTWLCFMTKYLALWKNQLFLLGMFNSFLLVSQAGCLNSWCQGRLEHLLHGGMGHWGTTVLTSLPINNHWSTPTIGEPTHPHSIPYKSQKTFEMSSLCIYIYIYNYIYPPGIKHGYGKLTIFRWFSELETSINSGIFHCYIWWHQTVYVNNLYTDQSIQQPFIPLGTLW